MPPDERDDEESIQYPATRGRRFEPRNRARPPTEEELLFSQPGWRLLRKQLVLKTYKLNQSSITWVDDYVHTGVVEFMAVHGHDIDALGGQEVVLRMVMPFIANARDRRRKGYDKRKGSAPLTPVVLGSYYDESSNPERMLMENARRHTWERFVERVTKLAEPYPCATLLMKGFELIQDDILARDAGYTQAQINNERQRLKRLGEQAAEELGLPRPAPEDSEGAVR